MSLKVYAPASIGNVGVGFDLLGAALVPIDGSLSGDIVSIDSGPKGIEFQTTGDWKHKLPIESTDNIVFQCAKYFLDQMKDKYHQGLKINLQKNLPVGSGLGSSASSVVAAFYALNEFFNQPFSKNQLLEMMGSFEGRVSGSVHFDNVAPSYLGGIQLMLRTNNHVCDRIPEFSNWFWVVAYPGISLSTAKMRDLLPPSYPIKDLIEFGRCLSGFIHASYQKNQKLAVSLLKDVVAEPYRSSHIPGYSEAKSALSQLGMLTTGISGSGPTLFTITDNKELAETARQWLEKNYLANSEGFTHICKIDTVGARRLDDFSGSFQL